MRGFGRRTGGLLAAGAAIVLAMTSGAAAGSPLTWTQLHPSASPSARGYVALAYDDNTRQVVQFGGVDGSGFTGDTWLWNGKTWTQAMPAASPSPRDAVGLGYDPATKQLVMFGGGSGGNTFYSDTWTWNGTTWTQASPTNVPPARTATSVAYDPATNQFLMFGGGSFTTGQFLDDMWSWDGTNWTQLSPATIPSARNRAAMAFDPVSRRLILFGGYGPNGDLSDTWAWDGTTWTQLSPSTSPPARGTTGTVFDPAVPGLVLFGGIQRTGKSFPLSTLSDTWKWNGTTWTQLHPAASPPGRAYTTLAYDAAGGQLLTFGGMSTITTQSGSGTQLGDTWAILSSFTLSVSHAGKGSVTSKPAGISCPKTCSKSFASGTKVTLSAHPAQGYTFKGWGGACHGTGACSVTMSAAETVSAAFAKKH